MAHDYKRHGTTTLFAALDVLTGKVIGSCLPKHRHSEFVKFFKVIDSEVPQGLQVHLIVDNYSTHKHSNVQAWLEKHPRFHLHFTPTSSSWLNLVERWFHPLLEFAEPGPESLGCRTPLADFAHHRADADQRAGLVRSSATLNSSDSRLPLRCVAGTARRWSPPYRVMPVFATTRQPSQCRARNFSGMIRSRLCPSASSAE